MSQDEQDVDKEILRIQESFQQERREFVKTGSSVDKVLEEISALNKLKLTSTRAAAQDAQTLAEIAEGTYERVKRLKLGSSAIFGLKDLDECVRQRAEDHLLDEKDCPAHVNAMLSGIGALAYKVCLRPRTSDFLVGPLNVQRRAVAARERLVKSAVGQELQADNLQAGDNETDEGLSSHRIKQVYASLKDAQSELDGPVELFAFVLNPNSYTESIENLFHLSFLLNMGKVALYKDHKNQPVVSVIALLDPSNVAELKSANKHVAFDMDFQTWQDLCAFYDVTQPIIPPGS